MNPGARLCCVRLWLALSLCQLSGPALALASQRSLPGVEVMAREAPVVVFARSSDVSRCGSGVRESSTGVAVPVQVERVLKGAGVPKYICIVVSKSEYRFMDEAKSRSLVLFLWYSDLNVARLNVDVASDARFGLMWGIAGVLQVIGDRVTSLGDWEVVPVDLPLARLEALFEGAPGSLPNRR